LASICRDSRESLSAGTDPLVWCNGLFSDTLVTLNGQKLTEPVLFLLGQAILPLEGTEELQLFGKLGGEDEPPSFTPGETPPTMVKANAATKNMGKQTNYLLGSRAFLLPIGNHGIPLGIPFDPAYCIHGETFADACQAFTGLPNEAYDWMRNNNQLDPFLWAVENSPQKMKVRMHFQGEIEDSWKTWKSTDSFDSRMTINQAESALNWKIHLDKWSHSGTKAMCDKWKAWIAHSMTVIKQSPDLAEQSREHPINCNFLPKVCTPARKIGHESSSSKIF
jgi:hypothetical protein